MSIELKFFKCEKCGKMVEVVADGSSSLTCCNEKMIQLTPNTTDAAQEKHVPVGTIKGNQLHVVVGSVAHPMTEEHHIAWVYVVQGNKVQRQLLDKTGKPEAIFTIEDGPIKIYEYCNLHGLWESSIAH